MDQVVMEREGEQEYIQQLEGEMEANKQLYV
jgi:hypothetical protein